MAESLAISRYLASQHGWFGSNPHETAHIDMYCESWSELYQKYIPLIGNGMYRWNRLLSQETIDKELLDLSETVIIPILTKHEEALAKNGTGYYVGDKVGSDSACLQICKWCNT
jgi:glutathione S-transferase